MALSFASAASFQRPVLTSMCEGMWTRWLESGTRALRRSAASAARSGHGDASRAWIVRWSAPGCAGASFRAVSRAARTSAVPGCGLPSFVHWSQGRVSISASAASVATSASAGKRPLTASIAFA